MEKNEYVVVIAGGGLAGLTLALQLTNANSSISILVIEKRSEAAPIAGHKIGESIVELSAHYLRKDLGLKECLAEHHLPKFGFRYFLDSDRKGTIEDRIEIGSKTKKQAPSHHIDRGVFENDLTEQIRNKGVDIWMNSSLEDANITSDGHLLKIDHDGVMKELNSKWLIDATGRRSFLKRKLNLQVPIEHPVNSVWFRIDQKVDPQEWSTDQKWISHLPPDFRRLSTNHFLGKGYWLWIIPLVNDKTSIGIVATEKDHPFTSINSLDKALDWIEIYEPLVAQKIDSAKDNLIDFKVIRNYAHDTKRFISNERWCLTGESGTFLDPFYSPGTDFIALSNTWITDLICREYKGEDVTFRINLYEHTQRQLIDGWYSLYKDLYSYLSGSRLLLAKIVWDWSTYWSILVPMFINKGFTNIEVMKFYASNQHQIGQRFNQLNENLQKLFNSWSQFDQEKLDGRYINVFDLEYLYKFHVELQDQLSGQELQTRISDNLVILEKVASELFRKAYFIKNGHWLSDNIDPYTMDINVDNSWKGTNAMGSDTSLQNDLSILWRENLNQKATNGKHLEFQKEVERIFQSARTIVEAELDINVLIDRLATYPAYFQSVAFEGASFEIGLEAIKADKLDRWFDFYNSSPKIHEHHIIIGFGWAFGALKTDPVKFEEIRLNTFIQQMLHDGIGYYNALFKVRRTIEYFEIPAFISSLHLDSFDQGVGRRIWYHTHGVPSEIGSVINSFPLARRENLWRGVGLACGYVGGTDQKLLSELIQIADKYHFNLASGVITSAIYSLNSSRNSSYPYETCSIVSNINENDLDQLRINLNTKELRSTAELIAEVETNIFTLHTHL